MNDVEILQSRIRGTFPSSKRALARRPHPVGFFRYYFRERSRIAAWNERTGLLTFGVVGVKLELVGDFRKRLSELVTEEVFPLYARAEKILEEGWRWPVLSVKEYNAMVFFVDLCEKLVALSNDRSLAELSIAKTHEALLRLTLRPDYQRLLMNAFEKVLMRHNRTDSITAAKMKRRIDGLNRFLSSEAESRSIYSFVRGYFMVLTRRYLEWGDLVHPTNGEWLPGTFYNCSTETLKQLMAYFRELSSDIESLRKRLDWLTTLRELSGVTDGRAPKALIKYYEAPGHDWRVDGDDFFLLVLTLVKRVRQDLDALLHARFDVMTPEEKIIQTRVIDDEKLESLYVDLGEHLASAEGRYRTLATAGFAVPMYRASENPLELLPTEEHKNVYRKVSDVFTCLFQIGVTLRQKWEENSYRDSFYLKHMIVNPQNLRGRPVIDVFATHTERLLQICGYFKHRGLMGHLRRVPKLQEALRRRVEEKERLDRDGLLESILKASAGKSK